MLSVMSDEWLSVRDVAHALRKSEPTVRRAIGRGDLTAYTLGGRGSRGYSVAPGDLMAFIRKCRTDSGDVAGGAAGGNKDQVARAS
jgi:hypothetical protein